MYSSQTQIKEFPTLTSTTKRDIEVEKEIEADEMNIIRLKLQWAKKHHNVMRRAIMQLER